MQVDLKVLLDNIRIAENQQNELQMTMQKIETEIGEVEESIEIKKHYFLGSKRIGSEHENLESQKQRSRVDLLGETKFDSEASLVKMLRKKMQFLQKEIANKNQKLEDCQTTGEFTRLSELELAVAEKNEELLRMKLINPELVNENLWKSSDVQSVKRKKDQSRNFENRENGIGKFKNMNGKIETGKQKQNNSRTNLLSLKKKLTVDESCPSLSKMNNKLEITGNETGSNLSQINEIVKIDFLRNHLRIESVRQRNTGYLNFLQNMSIENQHFNELKKTIRSELVEQNKQISCLNNRLADKRNTFEFCQLKVTNAVYLNQQKIFAETFQFF